MKEGETKNGKGRKAKKRRDKEGAIYMAGIKF